MGLYSDSLERRMRAGPIVRGLCELQFGWPTIGATIPYAGIGTSSAKSDVSGAVLCGPVGVGFAKGEIPAAKINKIVIRYPDTNGSPLYEVQVDNKKTWKGDGSLKHAALHFYTPSGYTAGSKIGVGYSDTFTFSSTPNYTSVTSTFASDANVQFSLYTPKVCLALQRGAPNVGDSMTLTISDGLGADQVYTASNDHIAHIAGNARSQMTGMMLTMMQNVTTDPSGRYRCFENTFAKIPPIRPGNDPREYSGTEPGNLIGSSGNLTWAGRTSQNSSNTMGIGVNSGNQAYAAMIPTDWDRSGISEPYGQHGFLLWQRYDSGNPQNFTATFALNRTGRTLGYDTVAADLYGGKVLQYDNQTADFNLSQAYWIKGRTSGAIGGVHYQRDITSTTGYLILRYVQGTFQDNEIIDSFLNGAANTTWGSATVNGTLVQNRILDTTTGGTADLLDSASGVLRVANLVGTFGDNNTITDLAGGSALVNGAISGLAAWTIQMSSADTTGSTSGTLPAIESPANRVSWSASWADGTDTSIPVWFNGALVHERERKIPLKDGSGNLHPHLEVRMSLKWNAAGTIVDYQTMIENTKGFAGAKTYWYDCTAINLGGVNQISSLLADYRDKAHWPSARWVWFKPKPSRVFCDTMGLMKSRLTMTWKHYRSKDYRTSFRCMTQGLDVVGDVPTYNSTMYDYRGGYSKSKPGIPLYAGPIKFDAGGGASPGIGVVSWQEYCAITGDPFLNWDDFLALCDNCWNAYPWYIRDENGPTNWTESEPHPYLRWQLTSVGAYGGASLKWNMGEWHSFTDYNHPGDARKWSVWPGYMQPGYGSNRSPAPSHSPAHPGRTAYLMQPERRHLEGNNMYCWNLSHSDPAGNSYGPPKTGGVAGDVDHIQGYSTSNGPRTWAWTWRSHVMATSILPDGHPHLSVYERVCNDHKNHFYNMTSRTWNGMIYQTNAISSDYPIQIYTQLAGQTLRYPNGEITQTNYPTAFDYFKATYVSLVAGFSTMTEVADCTNGLDYQMGYARMVEDLPSDKWYMFTCIGALMMGPSDSPTTMNATTPTIWATESFAPILTEVEAKTTLWGNRITTMPYQTTPQKDCYRSDAESVGMRTYWDCLGVPLYVTYRFYQTHRRMLAELMSDSTKRSRMKAVLDLLDGYIPYDEVDVGARGGFTTSTTYDEAWAHWSTRDIADVSAW